jgi:ectoine hydroxylase-related dioxygenase (phytanoyl-CoA dioxygenase family)
MKYLLGTQELELGGPYLTDRLVESNDIIDDAEALRKRMQEDGYLLLRGFHDADTVRAARLDILKNLQKQGKLDESHPLEAGVIGEGNKGSLLGRTTDYESELPNLLKVVNSQKIMDFFSFFLGGPSVTFDYKWPRAVPHGEFTGAHYDVVYMGRGSKNLYTMWTPLGDVPMELGSLAICLGSHRFEQLKGTYGEVDVSRDQLQVGWFSNDPVEIVDKFGGRWATTDYKAGDLIIFGMYTLHMSTVNRTNTYRTSCDTRYQLQSEPIDARFMGKNPVPPSADGVVRTTKIEQLREKWNI